MSVRKTVLAATVAGALGLPAVASAVMIDGITFEAGAIFETIDLFEAEAFGDGNGNDNGIIDLPGEQLVGIGIVNRILDADTNAVLWQNGDNGRELTIYFYNYIAENISPNATGDLDIDFTGGVVEIYSDTALDFSAVGTQAAGIATATNGNLWLSLTGSPIGDASLIDDVGALSGNAVTLRSTGIDNSLGDITVLGAGNLDVTGGLAAANFDTDTFNCVDTDGDGNVTCPDIADKRFSTSGQLNNVPGGNGWGFTGTGEVQDFAVPVPAPLALIGLGMAAASFAGRRKANKSV